MVSNVSTQPLIRITCVDQGEKIGLTNYADLIVFDADNTVVALRIGGYPEMVQAMSDAIITGCELELQGARETICVNTKGHRNYERKLSHDGIYAEGIHYLKDSVPQSFLIGDDETNNEKVVASKDIYFFCHNDDELFAEIDRKLSVPLIPEFQNYLLSELRERKILMPLKVYSLGHKFMGWHIRVSDDEKEVVEVLEDGLRTGRITIPGNQTGNTAVFEQIQTFTQYLQQFGTMIAKRIQHCFPPRFDPAKEPVAPEITTVNEYIRQHTGYSLFDAQLGAAEALRRQLESDKIALLVAECGSGKTKVGSMALYAYQHGNPKRRVCNQAFNVVICPSHITGKWVREIHETIPDSFALHVTSMADIDRLWEIYRQENKSVYCILSKETARNGYM